MGKGYPMWVKDRFEYKTISRSYRALCHSHLQETAFHAEAKRQFAAVCRADATHGATYNHTKISVSDVKSQTELDGGDLLTGF